MGNDFKFKLGDQVSLCLSGETGTVIGRAEYQTSENSYYTRYVAADGRQVEEWIGESSLNAKPQEQKQAA